VGLPRGASRCANFARHHEICKAHQRFDELRKSFTRAIVLAFLGLLLLSRGLPPLDNAVPAWPRDSLASILYFSTLAPINRTSLGDGLPRIAKRTGWIVSFIGEKAGGRSLLIPKREE
jgi:hypothetical protein